MHRLAELSYRQLEIGPVFDACVSVGEWIASSVESWSDLSDRCPLRRTKKSTFETDPVSCSTTGMTHDECALGIFPWEESNEADGLPTGLVAVEVPSVR